MSLFMGSNLQAISTPPLVILPGLGCYPRTPSEKPVLGAVQGAERGPLPSQERRKPERLTQASAAAFPCLPDCGRVMGEQKSDLHKTRPQETSNKKNANYIQHFLVVIFKKLKSGIHFSICSAIDQKTSFKHITKSLVRYSTFFSCSASLKSGVCFMCTAHLNSVWPLCLVATILDSTGPGRKKVMTLGKSMLCPL